VDVLRALAAAQGVTVTDDDLERVGRFLALLIPAWSDLEEALGAGDVPLGLPLADPSGGSR
jgi:hypothetical protein